MVLIFERETCETPRAGSEIDRDGRRDLPENVADESLAQGFGGGQRVDAALPESNMKHPFSAISSDRLGFRVLRGHRHILTP